MSDPLGLPYEGLTGSFRRIIANMGQYIGLSGAKRRIPIDDTVKLANFLDTRASFVAQTSLYGYMRTRAGVRYAELFHDNTFIEMLNIAKWHIWLDCLGDLAAYAGYLILKSGEADREEVGRIISSVVGAVLEKTGLPEEAGGAFAEHVDALRARILSCEWDALEDGEAAFTASPDSLVEWSPIVETLKHLDKGIVRNSMRFRWQEIRRSLRDLLDPAALVSSARI